MTFMKLTKIAIVGVLCTSSFVFANIAEECNAISKPAEGETVDQAKYKECKTLAKLSGGKIESFSAADVRANVKASANGKIQCVLKASYTFDYDGCEKAVNLYNYVLAAETAMNLQQQVRAEVNSKKLQEEAVAKAAAGDYQVGALDANERSQRFSASLYKERVLAFSGAVAALAAAIRTIPGEKKVQEKCNEQPSDIAPGDCMANYKRHKGTILANGQATNTFIMELARYTAEVARSLAEMKKSEANANISNKMKNSLEDMTDDQKLFEDCVLNPTDPKCAINRNRNPIDQVADGGINFGGEGSNNAFDLNGDGGNFFEEGKDTSFDDKEIASVNSPFSEEAKAAQGILDPAAAANVQFGSGGANGGGGGGSAGGGGGGGAPAAGAPEGEEQVAGMTPKSGDVEFEKAGGKGFSAVGKGKDANANPFASLFDSKGSGGGIEEDRSIASGDISGQSSGLFQKISKRYGQIQADKRVQTNNVE